MITFGDREPGISYTWRPGVYGIILNETKNLVAIIETNDRKYFLPGGGMEGSENAQECLVREGIEEMGKFLKIGEWIGNAQQYFYSPNDRKHYLAEGHYYFASITGDAGVPSESDHHLKWIEIGEAVEKLFHEHQSWALHRAMAIIETNGVNII